ncbi:type III-A CRISPR-associated protein Csm2 [Peptostreptococcus stomatis]|jgi:CRISPR-associated protein, csm2 family|nr:type III-A CRISPR-associated protein Csm2 [uncultured Peptostreptococcus sp.]
MAYNQNNSKNNFKRNINRNDVDIKKIISDYETDYSKTAEKVIKTLIEKYGERKILTTSKIRNILAMTADIYNDVNDPSEMKGGILSENIQARIRYLKIRIIYESGRENDVKNFVEESCIVDIINSIGDKKANYIRFSRYMEALVAYRKYLVSYDK